MKRTSILLCVFSLILCTFVTAESDSVAKIAFQSSGIEVWAGNGDYSSLLSEVYQHRDRTGTRMLPMTMPLQDRGEDLVFNDVPLILALETEEDLLIDIININIGNGAFSHLNTGARDNFYKSCNIILVDRAYIDRIYYADEKMWNDMGNGKDWGFPECINRLSMDNQDYLDVSGAILLPFDPVEFTPEHSALRFRLNWNDIYKYDSLEIAVEAVP